MFASELDERPNEFRANERGDAKVTISPPNQSPLHRTVHDAPTDVWNDSCSPRELEYAIGNGAVGATTNPSIVLAVLRKEFETPGKGGSGS